MKKFLLLFLYVQACIIRNHFVDGSCFAVADHRVHVVSHLPQDSAPLRIHCASKDDDLGYHNLFPGQDFHWSFCAEFLPITLFFCHLWWFPKEKAFEVYKESFTRVRTPQSWWVAKSDGIYFSNQTHPTGLTKRFNWEG